MFKEMLIQQLKAIGKYEIEELNKNTIRVYDTEDEVSTEYEFDNGGNLKDIY